MSWNPPADLSYAGKQAVLAEHFDRFPREIVVETGLYNGRGACFQFVGRARVVCLDVNPAWCLQARLSGVETLAGDSRVTLPRLLRSLDRPAFFWLDAHRVVEALEENDSPLYEELEAILAWPHADGSVVLVDDVRMMGRPGWPSIVEVGWLLYERAAPWRATVEADILRLLPL